MIKNELIKIEDILFVYNQWTLMVKSALCGELRPGGQVILFDEYGVKLSEARLGKFLSSRNPQISAIEVNAQSEISDMKKVKLIQTI